MAQSPPAEPDRIQVVDEWFPGAEVAGDGWILARVVDDLTGAPVAGAEVFVVGERLAPIAGEFWFERRVETDRDGWLRVQVGDLAGRRDLLVLRHPEYGVAAQRAYGGVWRVGRPFDVPVQVLDWRGAPAAGASLGFCGGCGHTPDLVNATTDAEGRAVLAQVDPHSDVRDVYVQRAGLGLGPSLVQWSPGDPPILVHCRWSPAMTGAVVDHVGRPVGGVLVAAAHRHRGPWTRTREDGTFTLLGGRPGDGVDQVRLADGRDVWFPVPRQYPVTLRLPDLADPTVHVGTLGPRQASEPAAPRLRPVQIVGAGSDNIVAHCRYPGARAARSESRAGSSERLEVPERGPFVIDVWLRDGPPGRPYVRHFAFDDAAQLPGEPVVLEWFAPTVVRGQVVDAAGAPVAATVTLGEDWGRVAASTVVAGDDGEFAVSTFGTGLTVLTVEPRVAGLRPRRLWLTLPLRGHLDVLEVGVCRLAAEPQLRVLDVGGVPWSAGLVSFARAGLQEVGSTRQFELDAAGGWLGPDLAAGDAIVVQLDEAAVPFRTVLRGAGPWTIQVPRGELGFEVVDVQGAPLAASVVIGDHLATVSRNAPLRGLPLGPLRAWVSAPGHRSAAVEASVAEAPRTVRIALPRR